MAKQSLKRCPDCWVHTEKCICDQFIPHTLTHKITCITSKKEARIISNTGRYIPKILPSTETILVGVRGWEDQVHALLSDPNYRHVLFFPNPTSAPAKEVAQQAGKPLNIIILDTSWAGARRWMRKKSFLGLTKVELKQNWKSHYHLRSVENKNYLCTLESLSALFKELHDDALDSVSTHMDECLGVIVEKLAQERGKGALLEGSGIIQS